MARQKKYNFKNTNCLYILNNTTTNEYKIGYTNNINQRLAKLQTGCPHELVVIKLYFNQNYNSVKRYERILHNYYKKQGKKIRENGEWYKLEKEDINLLCKPNTTLEVNELIENLRREM